jgi:hypothetical protein
MPFISRIPSFCAYLVKLALGAMKFVDLEPIEHSQLLSFRKRDALREPEKVIRIVLLFD